MTITRGPHLSAAFALLSRFAGVHTRYLPNGACADSERSPVGWPTTRTALVDHLRRRLNGRDLPRQLKTSYCGPAAFLYCLLEDRPDLYTAYALSMWERGEYDFRTLDITSDAALRTSVVDAQRREPNVNFVSDLDWMTMAPLSASTRPLGRVLATPAPRDQFGSISYPGVVRGWFSMAGARLLADTMGLGLAKSAIELTLHLLSHWANSWIVLQIDSSLLRVGGQSGNPTGTNTLGNRHWVVVNPHRQPLVRAGAGGRRRAQAGASCPYGTRSSW